VLLEVLGLEYSELTMLGARPTAPVVAHGFSGSSSGSTWRFELDRLHHLADQPVPRIITGLRYLSARSKASIVRSAASCTVDGANTSMR